MITRKKQIIRLCLPVLFTTCSSLFNFLHAQNSVIINVLLNKNVFAKGDTINIEATLPNYTSIAKTATLQLWIENVKTGRRWKYRYPLINGYINAKLKVDSNMNEGVYAFNFLLQKTFFSLSGHAVNVGKKDKLLNYVMISKNKQTVIDVVALNEQKDFSVRNLLFQDSAFIIFSKPNHKNNDLQIDIKTALDSSFVPLTSVTKFISVGDTSSSLKQAGTSGYTFKADNTKYKIILPEVVLKTKSNKRLEDFDRENTSGNFSSPDAIVLDGITSEEIANAPDFYTYLSIKVGGLRVETDNTTGNRSFTWRGQPTEIYINEIKLDQDIPVWINPSDIAMIKIFRPGTTLTSDAGAGGAIAIYTKTGEYKQSKNRNYSFYISGYTGLESTWK
jgi:hypothetical protein